MFGIYLQETNIVVEPTLSGAAVIIAILFASYLVTKYTKYGGR